RGDPAQTFTVKGSLIANNGSYNCADGGITDLGGNVEDGTDCGFRIDDGSVRLNDGLSQQGGEAGVLTLSDGSPAIDAGGDCTGADQRDVARPQGVACDAGAYELQPGVQLFGSPPSVTNQRTVRFLFGSDDGSATFECRLDLPGDDGTFQ